MILYHYTNEYALKRIIKEVLLNMFGLIWFTSSSNTENTVNMHGRCEQARVSVLKDKSIRSFAIDKERKYDLFSQFMNVELIGLISDTSKWYYTHKSVVKNIIKYEIFDNGEWRETNGKSKQV